MIFEKICPPNVQYEIFVFASNRKKERKISVVVSLTKSKLFLFGSIGGI